MFPSNEYFILLGVLTKFVQKLINSQCDLRYQITPYTFELILYLNIK